MPKLPLMHLPPRVKTAKLHRVSDKRESSTARGYGYRWQVYRARYLQQHPICVECLERSKRIVEATVVDHIQPHRNDPVLMWDPANHRAVCAPCHNRGTAAHDGGFGNPESPKRTRRSFNPDGSPTGGW